MKKWKSALESWKLTKGNRISTLPLHSFPVCPWKPWTLCTTSPRFSIHRFRGHTCLCWTGNLPASWGEDKEEDQYQCLWGLYINPIQKLHLLRRRKNAVRRFQWLQAAARHKKVHKLLLETKGKYSQKKATMEDQVVKRKHCGPQKVIHDAPPAGGGCLPSGLEAPKRVCGRLRKTQWSIRIYSKFLSPLQWIVPNIVA